MIDLCRITYNFPSSLTRLIVSRRATDDTRFVRLQKQLQCEKNLKLNPIFKVKGLLCQQNVTIRERIIIRLHPPIFIHCMKSPYIALLTLPDHRFLYKTDIIAYRFMDSLIKVVKLNYKDTLVTM